MEKYKDIAKLNTRQMVGPQMCAPYADSWSDVYSARLKGVTGLGEQLTNSRVANTVTASTPVRTEVDPLIMALQTVGCPCSQGHIHYSASPYSCAPWCGVSGLTVKCVTELIPPSTTPPGTTGTGFKSTSNSPRFVSFFFVFDETLCFQLGRLEGGSRSEGSWGMKDECDQNTL